MTLKSSTKNLILLGILPLFIGVLLSLFSEQLGRIKIGVGSGQGVPQHLIGIGVALFILLLIYFLPVSSQEKKTLSWLWILRSFVTLGFMIFYESIYSLDASLYYRDAILGHVDFSWTGFYGTSTVTALAALLNSVLPLFNSYHAIKVIFSLFGLLGAWFFYLAFSLHFGRDTRLLWLLGAFPSLLFWSSILGKDPITFLGLGIFALGVSKLYKEYSLRSLLIMFLGAAIISMVRFWLPVIFSIPIAIAFLISKKRQGFSSASQWLTIAGFAGFFVFALNFFAQKVNFSTFMDAYERVNFSSRSWSSGGSSLDVPQFGSWVDMLAFLPRGAFTALFRPLPGEVNNIFGMISGLENFALLFLLIRYNKPIRQYFQKIPYVKYLTVGILVWASIYGFFSYQNLGTAVRFKLQILPFIIALIYLGIKRNLDLENKES